MHRALVLNSAGDALRNLQGSGCAKVPVVGALLHRVDGPHAAVALQAGAVFCIDVLAWRLLRAGQQASAHRGASAEAQGLDDVPRARDAAIGEDRDAPRARVLRHVEDRRGLGPSTSADLLGGADGADAHADAEPIHAAVDEVLCLRLGDNVAADDLQVGELLLHPPKHLVLEDAIPLAAVHDDGVHTGGDQRAHPVFVTGPRPDGRRNPQTVPLVLRSVRVVRRLLQVRPRHKRHQSVVRGDHGQLALLRLLQNLVRGLQLDPLLRRN
mmetsp:Transcript_65942/g.190243  ORF Transcript_65942/g.190243 Transcript_65942/m.190243 type:complete len:269 (-) Transcript_65942:763-1569(-)